MDSKAIDYVIVGAGFSGAVCARQLADHGKNVLVIDERQHIGGNAWDEKDEYGVLIHPYGPHIFHTNSEKIFSYLSQFTEWRKYEHKVLASLDNQLYPFPINRNTVNSLYSKQLDEAGVKLFLETVKVRFPKITNSEQLVLSTVGRELCDLFFRGYTKKQWGLDLAELTASVASRIPVRTNDDDRYFTDKFQFMPKDGYATLFKNLLDDPRISVDLDTNFENISSSINGRPIIYTGPIDRYFNYCYGALPYRSLKFQHKHISSMAIVQPVGTINFPNENDYTRITEFKQLTGQKIKGTSIAYEFPTADGPPYYPVPTSSNRALYKKYKDRSKKEKGVYFVGRLAEYQYYNMDQAVGAALALSERLTNKGNYQP